ncbi:MAG: hypothetical protein ACXWH7_01110 [Thermoanaerobaculia bacterium]
MKRFVQCSSSARVASSPSILGTSSRLRSSTPVAAGASTALKLAEVLAQLTGEE